VTRTWRLTAATVAIAVVSPLLPDVQANAGATPPAVTEFVVERLHYSIAARIRPLLVFWLSRSGVGDAVVTRRTAPGEASYSLLIGSDPERAPRRINRWGYIQEEISGAEAHLIGLMTESQEETVEQAQENLKTQAAGRHPFKVIRATVSSDRASSLVTTMTAPEDYTFRELETVLRLAVRDDMGGRSRVLQLQPGTRPGLLTALADAMHDSSRSPIRYVYDGRLYELRQTRLRHIPDMRIGGESYGPAVAADFMISSTHDGTRTPFSMTYGTEGRFAQVPLKVSYQPRWWMQVELTIEEATDRSYLSDRTGR